MKKNYSFVNQTRVYFPWGVKLSIRVKKKLKKGCTIPCLKKDKSKNNSNTSYFKMLDVRIDLRKE